MNCKRCGRSRSWPSLNYSKLLEFTSYKTVKLFIVNVSSPDRLCGLVLRVLGYRSGGPSSIPGTTKKIIGLERGPLSLMSTTEELLDRKVAAPV
jgi:hypothetical protein